MDFNEIKELIDIFDKSSLTDMRLNLGEDGVELSKSGLGLGTSSVVTAAEPVSASAEHFADEAVSQLTEATPLVDEGYIVKSPIVGTFFNSASPDKPPFVKVGDVVQEGKVLCIIEAMKVMNEITANQGGTVAEILVKNEDMVEFNQPLFRIV